MIELKGKYNQDCKIFIDGSVTIDGTKATSSEYKYDEQTHTLTVNLDTITPSSSSTLTFLVKKKS